MLEHSVGHTHGGYTFLILGVPLTTPSWVSPAHIIGFMFANMACKVYAQGSAIIYPGMHMYAA